MDERRWKNANRLVELLRQAEQAASEVGNDYFHERIRWLPKRESHPSEDQANDIKKRLVELRKIAAGIAEREASQ